MMRPTAIVTSLVVLAAGLTLGAPLAAVAAEEQPAVLLTTAAPITMAETSGQPSLAASLSHAPDIQATDGAASPITAPAPRTAADPAPPCPSGAAVGQRSSITIYAWLPAISARIGVDDVEASVHKSISDVLHHFKGGGAAHYESGGRTNFVLDVLYAKLEGTESIPATSIDWTVKEWLVEGAVTLGRTGTANHFGEGLIGARYFSIDSDISEASLGVHVADTKAWAEPFVGGRYGAALSPKWFVLFTGDVGGFSVGSRLTWEAAADFSYPLSGAADLHLGYRYLHIDYNKSGFEFVGSMSGPLVGVSWWL